MRTPLTYRRLAVATAVTCALGTLVACGGDEDSGTTEEQASLVVGTGIDATYGQIFVAVDQGFFEEEGIDAEYKTFEAGGESINQAAAGTVDIGAAGELPGLKPFTDGAPITYVATGLTTGESGGVGVAPGISEPSDLNGTTVGVLAGSTSELFETLFVEKHGLENVSTVNLSPPDMIPAMERGEVSAVFVWEPWLTRLTETVEGTSVPWRYGDDDVYTLHWGYWFNRDFVDEDPETAQGALRALIAASEWMSENEDEAAQIIADATRSSKDEVLAQMDQLDYNIQLTDEDVAFYAENIIPFAESQGLIPEVDDPTEFVRSFMNTDLLNEVDPERAS